MKVSIKRTLPSLGVVRLLSVAGVLIILGTASESHAQLVKKKPDVLLLIDTSGSMKTTLDGDFNPDCLDGPTDKGKARWTVLAESLTGTVEELTCSATLPIISNGSCRPVLNLHSEIRNALTADPYAWPRRDNGNNEAKDAVVFCGKSTPSRCTDIATWNDGEVCKNGNNEFQQLDDGLLDSYGRQLRFGLMTFDSVATVPAYISHGFSFGYWATDPSRRDLPLVAFNGDATWGTPDNCQFLTGGTGCAFGAGLTLGGQGSTSFGQYSYWHNSGGGSTWLNGVRTGYAGQFLMTNVSSGGPAFQVTFGEARIDAGVRNPKAPPSQGRMIGFGPPTWDVSNPGLVGCNSEDDCTSTHNEMVQRAILGASGNLVHTTPIAAMMRDAYEFEKFDTTTKGVHVPHKHNFANPSLNTALAGTIGLQTDPFYATSSCRTASNILITDGEPFDDLDAKGSDYAALIKTTAGINTYVLGVGLSSAQYSSDGLTLKPTVTCSNLRAADLVGGSGKMCERNAAGFPLPADLANTKWKYAEGIYGALSPDAGAIRACCNLLEIAVAGGTTRAYFPDSDIAVKQALNGILQDAAGTPVSRTIPVFNQTTATYAPDPAAPAVYYELRSSVESSATDTMWRGNLERVRYACNTTTDVPEIKPVDDSKGDSFQTNLANTVGFPRKFFTVVHKDVKNKKKNKDVTGSVRSNAAPNPNNHDGLYSDSTCGDFMRFGNNPSTGNDVPVVVESIATQINGLTGALDAKEILDTKGKKKACQQQTGTNNEDTCADRVLRWYGGAADPEGDGASGITPSRDPASPQCPTGQTCSPMGAIYNSSPIVIPPPSPVDSDDQSFGRIRSDGTQSFWEKYSTRPTMVYSQTIDGQLHAFSMNRNDTSAAAPDFVTGVPKAVTLSNNEMWTFIPPAVLPSIFPNFNVHSRLLDGQLAWANVVFERPYGFNGGVSSAAAANINHDFNTVLVGASGPSAQGGFYYAMDVTDPKFPRFLWQLRTAGNDSDCNAGDPLFGESVPGAAITHIRYLDSDGKYKILAVAVLPGGSPGTSPPSEVRDRTLDPASYWPTAAGFTDRKPRPKIRSWGYDTDGTTVIERVPSRSLTIVELKTGRILGRMVGNMSDNPNQQGHVGHIHNNTILDSNVVVDPANTPFDSPITGIPVPYPAGVGKVAERIYVGDADGTLWRIDLTDPSPNNNASAITGWQARIAFDAYNHGSNNSATLADAWVPQDSTPGKLALTTTDTAAATMGQPIQTAPLLSLDDKGEVVVTFSTGDQEEYNTVATGMINLLVSFTDQFDGLTTLTEYPPFRAVMDAVNGVELAWRDGGRVTGPINLFDGQLYFAYFTPYIGLTCGEGTGGICGVDYNAKQTTTAWAPINSTDLDGDGTSEACLGFVDGEIVFGISINLVPSCVPTNDSFNDPWLAGQYQSITQSNLGRYQLVYQTGSGGTAQNSAKTKSSLVNLPTPQSRTRVRSWVSVVE